MDRDSSDPDLAAQWTTTMQDALSKKLIRGRKCTDTTCAFCGDVIPSERLRCLCEQREETLCITCEQLPENEKTRIRDKLRGETDR